MSQLDIGLYLQLVEDSVAVGIHGLRTERELLRNAAHLVAVDDHRRDLQFPVRELVERIVAAFASGQHDALGNVGADEALAIRYSAYRVDHQIQLGPLADEPRHAGIDQALRRSLVNLSRQRNDSNAGWRLEKLQDGFQAPDSRHADVDHRDVRQMIPAALPCSLPAVGFGNDLDVGLAVQYASDTRAHQMVIVGYQYLDQDNSWIPAVLETLPVANVQTIGAMERLGPLSL